jgi:hypothetical protein
LRKRFSEQYAARNGVYRRRYNHEVEKEFNSQTNRLCYAGHMIRRPEDLPHKGLFKPNGRINQEIKVDGWDEQLA